MNEQQMAEKIFDMLNKGKFTLDANEVFECAKALKSLAQFIEDKKNNFKVISNGPDLPSGLNNKDSDAITE